MKNTKTLKLLVMVLSLVLLMSAAIAVAVSAAEDDTYAIKSINISHDDSIMVLMAVDAVGVDPATIEVKYTIGNGEAKTAKYYKNVAIYKNLGDETEYPVFYTEGIPMKDMGEDVKAEAHKVGTTPAAPQYKETGVSTYLFTKLYAENYISATEGEDLGRKNLYLNLLSYGAQAQKVLWNNKHPEAIRTLVTDLIPVYVEGATANGKAGLVKLEKADYLDLKYTGSDLLVGWKVATEDGVQSFYNNVYVSEGARVTPITAKSELLLSFDENYVEDTSGLYNKLTFTESGVVVSAGGSTNTGVNGKIGVASVKTDADGNKYLNIFSPGRGGSDKDRGHGIQTAVAKVLTEDANVTVLSFDIRGTAAINAIELVLRPAPSPYAQFNNVCALAFKSTTEWTNYRLEYYDAEDVVQLYINGEYQQDLANENITKLGSDIYACINGYNNSAFDIDIDNVAIYKTTKAYSAFPYTPKQSGSVYDFENATASVIGTNPDFTNHTFEGTPLYVKNNGSTHECSAGAEIKQDGNNKFFYMYAGKRVNGNDRGWSFSNNVNAEMLVPEAFANVGVLELDLKADQTLTIDGSLQSSGTPIFATFYFSGSAMATNAIRFDAKISGTDLKLAGNTFMTVDSWYTVRFEFNRGDNTINVYSKPQGESDWTRSFTIPATQELGALASFGQMSNISAGAFTGFNITGNNSGEMYSLSFDNISVYSTHK